ncbi:hypothetical protein AB6A40_000799 [Gnathostoma spinigerum]|uniref:Uncharacterized protein n=1 Tax=Gnathostoma spinigerum TaxID=75299 RepID=A0ABD6E2S6_9BILA
MTNSNRSGGWFSSVVNNLSGFWSRPPDRSSHSGRRSMPIHSIEEQEDPEEEVNASSLRPSTSIPENTDRKRSPELSTVCDGICKKSYGTERVENMIREEDEEIAGLSCAFPRNSNRYLSPSVFSPMDSSRVTSDRNTMRKRVFSGISDGDQSTLNIFGKTFSSHIFDTVPNGNSSKRVKNDDWPRNSHSSNKNSQSLFLDRSSAFDTSTFGLLTSSTVESGRASSVLRSRISRPPSSTTSSLSSKTRAVLMELEKISTPVKEVRKLPMSSTIESWSRDETSLPPGAPPRKSLCSLSRAQVISNTLASSTRKPYWRRPAHARFLKAEGEKEKFGQHSEPKEDRLSKDVVDGSSKTLEETASDPASGDKADARVPELEYDEGAENLADVDVALLKATKPLVMGENPLQPGFLGDTLFKFSSPVKRGPISITVKESEMKTDKHEEPEVADVEEKRGSGTDDSSEESEGEDVKDSTTELKKKTAASDSETSSSVSPAPVSTNGSPQRNAFSNSFRPKRPMRDLHLTNISNTERTISFHDDGVTVTQSLPHHLPNQ